MRRSMSLRRRWRLTGTVTAVSAMLVALLVFIDLRFGLVVSENAQMLTMYAFMFAAVAVIGLLGLAILALNASVNRAVSKMEKRPR